MAHYVIFIEFIKVTWRKNVTSYVKTGHLSQKRNSIRNVLKPTRSFGHFRFKSYGPLSDFHKSGDLDLALYPIFKKKMLQGPRIRIHRMSQNQDNRTSGVVCTSQKDGQTDKQTNRWKPLKERGYFSKPLRFFTVRLTLTATCQGQRLRVEIIQRNSVKLFKEIIQRNSVRGADFHFS